MDASPSCWLWGTLPLQPSLGLLFSSPSSEERKTTPPSLSQNINISWDGTRPPLLSVSPAPWPRQDLTQIAWWPLPIPGPPSTTCSASGPCCRRLGEGEGSKWEGWLCFQHPTALIRRTSCQPCQDTFYSSLSQNCWIFISHYFSPLPTRLDPPLPQPLPQHTETTEEREMAEGDRGWGN